MHVLSMNSDERYINTWIFLIYTMHLRNVKCSYIVDFFKTRNTPKKRDFLSGEKRESGMTLKKREFTPESGSVDTYVFGTERQRTISANCHMVLRIFYSGIVGLICIMIRP